MKRSWFWRALAIAQAAAGMRVAARLVRTARGAKIAPRDQALPDERVTVVVPVLNERARVGPCLAGLIAQPDEVAEILVVDGGSTDGTPQSVNAFAARDRRLKLVEAGPAAPGDNGKAFGLQVGLERADPASGWIWTVDADVRPAPALARSLLAQARATGAASVSVAPLLLLSGPAEALVHPALLTTLVYRFGIPGRTTRRVAEVQANGQCALYRRAPLEGCGGFRAARRSVCEDVTVARALAANGCAVGFHETDGLVSVAMYDGWREAWRDWPRSLPLRDRYAGRRGWLGLAEIVLAQALPLPLLAWVLLVRRRGDGALGPARGVNAALALMRLGVLAGAARAYPTRPWTYWLSPLVDAPAALQLWRSALRRRHEWRGRFVVREDRVDDA
jgi:dolichol-phosphate mannosyltransferase